MASRHFSFKTGKVGAGLKHAEYIAGQGKYSEREDVRHLSDHNLPGWAVDGRDFFAAADANERANGRSYSEIEFAIPRECPDPVAYARQYAEQLLGDRHTYRLAVHDKAAADGGRNVHGHLMFSERRLDGIERDREQFFRRANSKTPEKGGTAKDRQWNDRQHIQALRRGYEGHAKAHGIALDLRSNLAQGLTRPEPKIGPQRKRSTPDRQREARVDDVKQIRSNRKAIAKARADLTTIEKEERNERIRERRTRAKQRYQAAGVTEVHQLRGIDDLPDAAQRPEVLLQRDEPRRVEQPQAKPDHRLVHELDAQRAAKPVKPTGPTPEQWAQTVKALEAASKAAQQQAERKAAIRRTAQAEQQERRPKRREAWQAKHIRRPAIALAANTPPTPGKPRYWLYSDGPAKDKPCVVDYGDRIKPAGKTISDTKIAAMLEVAKAKGWPALAISGQQDFRLRVAEAAQARGMPLADRDLVQALAQRQAAAAEAQRAAQERQRQAQAEQERMKAQTMKEREAKAQPQRTSPSAPSQPPQAAKAVPEAPPTAPQGPTLAELRTELASLDKQISEVRAEQIPLPLPLLTAEEARYEAAREANRAAGEKLHPESQYEYSHHFGNGRRLHVAQQQREEHAKTQRPLLLGKAAWDAEAKRLNDKVVELSGAIASDSFKLQWRGKQIQSERVKASAERDEQIKRQTASKSERLAALAAKRAGIEAQIKHPRFAEQIKQEQQHLAEKKRQQQRGMGHGR